MTATLKALKLNDQTVTAVVVVRDTHPPRPQRREALLPNITPDEYLERRDAVIADLDLTEGQYIDGEEILQVPPEGNRACKAFGSVARIIRDKDGLRVDAYGWRTGTPVIGRVIFSVHSKKRTREVKRIESIQLSDVARFSLRLTQGTKCNWGSEQVLILVINEDGHEIGQVRERGFEQHDPQDLATAYGWVVLGEERYSKFRQDIDVRRVADELLFILQLESKPTKDCFFGPWKKKLEETHRRYLGGGDTYLGYITYLWSVATKLKFGDAHPGYPFMC